MFTILLSLLNWHFSSQLQKPSFHKSWINSNRPARASFYGRRATLYFFINFGEIGRKEHLGRSINTCRNGKHWCIWQVKPFAFKEGQSITTILRLVARLQWHCTSAALVSDLWSAEVPQREFFVVQACWEWMPRLIPVWTILGEVRVCRIVTNHESSAYTMPWPIVSGAGFLWEQWHCTNHYEWGNVDLL